MTFMISCNIHRILINKVNVQQTSGGDNADFSLIFIKEKISNLKSSLLISIGHQALALRYTSGLLVNQSLNLIACQLHCPQIFTKTWWLVSFVDRTCLFLHIYHLNLDHIFNRSYDIKYSIRVNCHWRFKIITLNHQALRWESWSFMTREAPKSFVTLKWG